MLRDRLQADLRDAMREKDQLTTATIRVLLGILANAEAIDGPTGSDPAADPMGASGLGVADVARRELTAVDELRLLDQERNELRATALMLLSTGNEQSAAELERRATVVDRYVSDAPR